VDHVIFIGHDLDSLSTVSRISHIADTSGRGFVKEWILATINEGGKPAKRQPKVPPTTVSNMAADDDANLSTTTINLAKNQL